MARRPHGQHTTVVMHLNVQERAAGLRLGPLLSESERQISAVIPLRPAFETLTGGVIGCGRTTRQINRRLRRAPGIATARGSRCGATRGFTPTIRHWQDGGATELASLGWCVSYQARCAITIAGPANNLCVADSAAVLARGSLARASAGTAGSSAVAWAHRRRTRRGMSPSSPQPPPISN